MSLVYYISNYYKMLTDLNLDINSSNYISIYKDNKKEIDNYYGKNIKPKFCDVHTPVSSEYLSTKQNLLNPLTTYIRQQDCLHSPGVFNTSFIKWYSKNGVLTYKDSPIQYTCPIINYSYRDVWAVCAERNPVTKKFQTVIPDHLKNVDKTKLKYPIENDFISINVNTNLITNIKYYLNNGFPIWFGANATSAMDNLPKNTAKLPDISPGCIWYSDYDPRTQKPSINGKIIDSVDVTGTFTEGSNTIVIDIPASGIDYFVNISKGDKINSKNIPSNSEITEINKKTRTITINKKLIKSITGDKITIQTMGSGHDMTIIGYIDNVPSAKKIDGSDGVIIVANSWGIWYADNGIFYITYNYLASPVSPIDDLFIVCPSKKYTNLYSKYMKLKSTKLNYKLFNSNISAPTPKPNN